jgi:hypothetical protein
MNKAMQVEHLKQAERHVIAGAFHIARQRELVSELERRGLDEAAAEGKKLLVTFEELQAMHIAGLRRLRKELDHLAF